MYRKISPLKLVLCASPKYIRKHGRISHPSELENHIIVGLHNHGLSGPLTLFRQDESYTINGSVNIHLSSNNLLSALNLVLEGKGINLMTPAWLATKYLKIMNLKLYFLNGGFQISPFILYGVIVSITLLYFNASCLLLKINGIIAHKLSF